MEDPVDVGVAVAASAHDVTDLLQVGDGVKSLGALLGAEAAVEVASDPDVIRIAGNL